MRAEWFALVVLGAFALSWLVGHLEAEIGL